MEILLSFDEAVKAGAPEKDLRLMIKLKKIKYRKVEGLRKKHLFLSSLVYFFNITPPVPVNITESAKTNKDIFFDLLEKCDYNQSKLAERLKLTRQAVSLILKEFESQ